jgi:hypothetical protein
MADRFELGMRDLFPDGGMVELSGMDAYLDGDTIRLHG